MAVIAVFNQKGGVGKTTTTLNLIAALARARQNPIGIDLDPQAHLTLASGLKSNGIPVRDIASFFESQTPLEELLLETPGHWQIIPSSQGLSKIDALYGSDPKAATRLRQGLAQSTALGNTPILIDCCPMLGVLTLNALLAADRVLIPVSADFLSLQGVHRLDAALSILEGKLHRRFERRIVVTRFDGRRKQAYEIYDHLKERYGAQVCNSRIGESATLAASPMAGKDIFTFAPHSPAAADYHNLAAELARLSFFNAPAKAPVAMAHAA